MHKDTQNKQSVTTPDVEQVAMPCYALRPTRWSLYPKDQGSMSEFLTVIELIDEGDGEFLVVKQPFARADLSAGGIAIDPAEWPKIRETLDAAFSKISEQNEPA